MKKQMMVCSKCFEVIEISNKTLIKKQVIAFGDEWKDEVNKKHFDLECYVHGEPCSDGLNPDYPLISLNLKIVTAYAKDRIDELGKWEKESFDKLKKVCPHPNQNKKVRCSYCYKRLK